MFEYIQSKLGFQSRGTNFVEHGSYDSLVAESVTAHQRVGVHAALRQPSGMLERRRRRLDVVDGDAVADGREEGI